MSWSTAEGRGRAERCTSEKTSKHAEKHVRTEITMHSDTEWRPDHDSEEYASSGTERILT